MDIKFTSLNLNKNLNTALNRLKDNLSRLSSGRRINKASDDAAGLAILNQLEASAATLQQGTRNTRDAISAISIAEGATGQINNLLSRQAELAAQAANGTNSPEQREALNAEFQQLEQEISRISSTTEFNGTNLLNGESITIQTGPDGSANSQLSVEGINLSQSSGNILTQEAAQAALDSKSAQISDLASQRAELGASQSRLEAAIQNNEVRRETELAAASRIGDVDIAEEVAKATANRIRAETTPALLAQAGKLNENSVLKLLS